MKKIIEDNYNSIKEIRGLITPYTTENDFLDKIREELSELEEAVLFDLPNKNYEIADIILTCMNYAKHQGIDIEKVLWEKVEYNKKRTD